MENIGETLKANISNNIHNKTIVKEMLAVLNDGGFICEETP